MNFLQDKFFMKKALGEAKKACAIDEVPVGAVLVSASQEILFSAYNQKEGLSDPLSHAELLAIREGAKKLQNWRLSSCTLYVSLEPCPMCLAALIQARIKRLVFGAYDLKGGALSLGYLFHIDKRLNHRFEVCGGVLQDESSELLRLFFKQKRIL